MYIPKHFRESDRDRLIAFMRENSFAILVTQRAGAPFATHLPLVIEADADKIVLKGHVAKANPQWHGFAIDDDVLAQPLPEGETLEALVIFHGPHAYISPENYESRQSVPTWNYIAVHAYGVPRKVDSKDAMLDAMLMQYEPAQLAQWHAQDEKYKAAMLAGIVAFEIEVTRLEGKYKLSQNRPEGDQRHIIESLGRSNDPTISCIAAQMQHHLD